MTALPPALALSPTRPPMSELLAAPVTVLEEYDCVMVTWPALPSL